MQDEFTMPPMTLAQAVTGSSEVLTLDYAGNEWWVVREGGESRVGPLGSRAQAEARAREMIDKAKVRQAYVLTVDAGLYAGDWTARIENCVLRFDYAGDEPFCIVVDRPSGRCTLWREDEVLGSFASPARAAEAFTARLDNEAAA